MTRVRLVGATLLIALLSLVPVAAASSPLPIPSLPTDLLSEPFTGTPAVAQPLPHLPIGQNPYLAANGSNSMHDDAYASDAYETGGPLGRRLQVRSATYGISECATIAFDSRGRIVGLCGGLEGFTLRLIDPSTLTQIAQLQTSTRDLLSLSNPFSDICGGTYFFLDSHDVAYVLTTDKQIWQIQVGPSGLTHTGTFDVSAQVPDGDCVVATMPDWSGRIFFATQQGRVGVVDPGTGQVHAMQFAGEGIFNSLAGDETGAIYLVTTHRIAAVAADAGGAPVVRWSQAYDRGTQQKPGQLSQGSGTTPTLIGNDLVAITDNAEPRMHVIFYRRTGNGPDHEICRVPVFGAGASATENSLAYAGGRSVIVENNYGYAGVQSTLLGKTTSPGVARVDLEGDGSCRVAWTNPVSAPTSVPKVSLGNGLLYVYTKPAAFLLDDSWYLTAIDVRTGTTRWSQRTGNGIQWNNHYASIYLGPDGAAYMPTLAGLIRFEDHG
ncbi:outer membrane protein assembly factor BamB [Marmoricola sp. URHA0025 HA25]